jgi:dihydropteroate synthase
LSAHNIRILNIANEKDAALELSKIGVDQNAIKIMVPKMRHLNIKIKNLDLRQAHIIKQRMLSLGADAAVHKKVITSRVNQTDAIIMSTKKQLLSAVKKLKKQPFGLEKIAEKLSEWVS